MNKNFALATVKAVDDDDSPNGSFEVILSAPTLDRDNEVIDAKAFEPLPDHITFDIDHGLSTATTVGSGQPYYEDDMLKVRGTFASTGLAQEVRTLVREGHIRTTSVAFMGAKKSKKDGVTHITSAELLNGSFVPVPSNREAAVLVAKSLEGRKPESKSVIGSYEERRELLDRALRDEFSEAEWLYIRATFADAVVVEVYGIEGQRTLRVAYTVNDGVISLGTAEEVAISEIVRPVDELVVDQDADSFLGTRSVPGDSTTDPESQAAAPAAASPPAEVGGPAATRAAVAKALADAALATAS